MKPLLWQERTRPFYRVLGIPIDYKRLRIRLYRVECSARDLGAAFGRALAALYWRLKRGI